MAAEDMGPPVREEAPGGAATTPHRDPDADAPASTINAPSVRHPADDWTVVREGWARAGDAMPRAGSLAWRCLPSDDPVKVAAAAVAALGAEGDVRRHGPAVARCLTSIGGPQ